jgi:hypothetical protein
VPPIWLQNPADGPAVGFRLAVPAEVTLIVKTLLPLTLSAFPRTTP